MNNPHYKEMANHFNIPNHSILSMKVHITEKIYHRTNSTRLSTPFRTKREHHD